MDFSKIKENLDPLTDLSFISRIRPLNRVDRELMMFDLDHLNECLYKINFKKRSIHFKVFFKNGKLFPWNYDELKGLFDKDLILNTEIVDKTNKILYGNVRTIRIFKPNNYPISFNYDKNSIKTIKFNFLDKG
jgi:hypothetical protein